MSALRGPVPLRADHEAEAFRCGDAVLDGWLRTRALRNQVEGASRTWVVLEGSTVVAFYASSTAVVLRSAAPGRAARNQPDPLPALLLGRLAVDHRHQGAGLGAALLKHFLLKALEVAELVGVRLLLVHAAKPEAAAFYEHHGFERSPLDQLTLLLLVKDLSAQSRPGSG